MFGYNISALNPTPSAPLFYDHGPAIPRGGGNKYSDNILETCGKDAKRSERKWKSADVSVKTFACIYTDTHIRRPWNKNGEQKAL